MALAPGTKIGPFEVTAPLGAGGMGEVYRATDSRLRREVAIKVLPDDVTRDRERLARFEREAHLLASLSHPNIGAIFGLEEWGESRCLILELIEGETLGQKIERGPLPVEEALGIALQLAEGLEAAHDKGIIHRDLKPANVKVTPDGTVKVLDFGLAKAFEGDASKPSSQASFSPTLSLAATQAGVILGTAAYMSPEQAAGQMVDRRSDIWAFGVVLFEMLTGKRTFGGETMSHTLASVLKEEPDWSALPADLPPRIRQLIERCLSKKVRRRLQAIGEARLILEEYRDAPQSFRPQLAPAPHAAVAVPSIRRVAPWVLVAALGAALASAPFWHGTRGPAPSPRRLILTLPEGQSLFRGYGSSLVMSPGGSLISYVTTRQGVRRLYVHYLDQWTGTVIVEGPDDTTGPYQPFFSPDGEWLGYVTRTELNKVPIRGGTPITLCSVDRSRGASWGPDGRIVFASSPNSGLFTIPASGGEPEPLTTLDEKAGEVSHRWPQVLPGGKQVLFTSLGTREDFSTGRIEVFDLTTRQRKVLHKGGTYARYAPTGHILYVNKGTLFAFPFDPATLEATGSVTPMIEGIGGDLLEGGAQFSVSDDGTLVYDIGRARISTTLVWADRQGNTTPLWDAVQDYRTLSLSPDGGRLLAEVGVEGNRDLWVYDLKRDVPTRLTFGKGEDAFGVWSPDGKFVYFSSERDGKVGIYRRASDGSGEDELILDTRESAPTSVSPDGKSLAVTEIVKGSGDILILPLDGGEPRPFVTGPAFEYGATYSPDGRWIAYGSSESGTLEIYVRPASEGRGKWQISRGGGAYPCWSRDGRIIYYRSLDGAVVSVDVETTGGAFRAGRIETLFKGPFPLGIDGANRYTVAPDGRFIMVKRDEATDETHEHLQIVIHWLDELRQTLAGGGPGHP